MSRPVRYLLPFFIELPLFHCANPTQSCGKTIRNADVGKTMLVESPKYPSKVTCGVNCVIK